MKRLLDKAIMYHRSRILAIVISSVVFPAFVSAQIPGHWQLVYHAPHWMFRGMKFTDAVHGVLLMDSGSTASLTTTNGGANWSLTRSDHMIFDPIAFHAIDMPTDSDIYVLSGVSSTVSRDGGVSWQQYKLAIPPCGAPASWRIFTNGIARAIAYTEGGINVWNSSDSAEYFYNVQSEDWLNSDSIRDVIFLDTSEFWVSYAGGQMIHTTDGGKSWKWIAVMPSLDSLHSFAWITSTPDYGRFYVIIDRGHVPLNKDGQWDSTILSPPITSDFAETTDDGQTWRIDSSLGSPRIYQLDSPGEGKLWVFIGRSPSYYLDYDDPTILWPKRSFFADSVQYSSDDGRTWNKDSTTFIGDTLMEMCWPDSNHGYIAARRDSSVLVYRFVANSSGVSHSDKSIQGAQIYPDPAFHSLTIRGVVPFSRVHLLDELGRKVRIGTVPATGMLMLDVSTLPCGIYYVRTSIGQGITVTRKVTIEH